MTTTFRSDSDDSGILHNGVEIITFDEDNVIINGDLEINGVRTGNGFRNKIIGGDFSTNPWVRGTSFAAAVSSAYQADRFAYSGNMGVVTIAKTADAPTANQAGVFTQHCLHVDVTTADASVAAGDLSMLVQKIEGYNAASFGFGQAGTRYVTLSFWHKHTKTGINCVTLVNGASGRSFISEYTQAVSDTWEKAVITVPVDTIATWLYDNGIGIELRFAMAAGTTYQNTANVWASVNAICSANQVNNLDNTANNFKIALVQLEAGQNATEFEVRSIQQESELCFRYCPAFISSGTTSGLGVGQAISTSSYVTFLPFRIPPRVIPTGITVSGATHLTYTDGITATNSTALTFGTESSFDVGSVTVTTAAVLTQFRVARVRFNNASGYILFTGCEL